MACYSLRVFPVGRAERNDLGEHYTSSSPTTGRVLCNVVVTQQGAFTDGGGQVVEPVLTRGEQCFTAVSGPEGRFVIPDVFASAPAPITEAMQLTVCTRGDTGELIDTGIDLKVYPFAVVHVPHVMHSFPSLYAGVGMQDAPCLSTSPFDVQAFTFIPTGYTVFLTFGIKSFTSAACMPSSLELTVAVKGIQYTNIHEDRANKVLNQHRLARTASLSKCSESERALVKYSEGDKKRVEYVGDARKSLVTVCSTGPTSFKARFHRLSCKEKCYIRLMVGCHDAAVCPLLSGMICVTAPRPARLNFHGHRCMHYMSKDFAELSAWFNSLPDTPMDKPVRGIRSPTASSTPSKRQRHHATPDGQQPPMAGQPLLGVPPVAKRQVLSAFHPWQAPPRSVVFGATQGNT